MLIECACAVCHGPIPRGSLSVTCSRRCGWYRVNCNRMGRPIGQGYEMQRMMQAYRRDHLALIARLRRSLPADVARIEAALCG